MPLDPFSLPFGVELEFYLPAGRTRQELADALTAAGVPTIADFYNHFVRADWKLVSDGSLGDMSRGTELVSPILRAPEAWASLETACRVLIDFGCTVNRQCGLHVHVGVRHLVQNGELNLDFFKRLIEIYARYEPVLDTLVSRSRRGAANRYALPVTFGQLVKAAKDLPQLRRRYGRNRHRKLNLEAFWRHGTVEFRQHQGTIDGDKVAAWARLCLRLVAAAARTGELSVLASANPKRPGSAAAARFELYRSGMTVAQAFAAGVTAADLRWDREHGFIAVTGPVVASVDLDGLITVLGVPPTEAEYLASRVVELSGAD